MGKKCFRGGLLGCEREIMEKYYFLMIEVRVVSLYVYFLYVVYLFFEFFLVFWFLLCVN